MAWALKPDGFASAFRCSRALREAQEIVWLISVRLGLEIFITLSRLGDLDPDAFPADVHPKPISVFDPLDGFI